MEGSDSSDDEPYGADGRWEGRRSFYEEAQLLHEIERLQAQLARLRDLEPPSLRTLSRAAFSTLTGFPTIEDAQEELEKCGEDFFFDELQLIGQSLDEELWMQCCLSWKVCFQSYDKRAHA